MAKKLAFDKILFTSVVALAGFGFGDGLFRQRGARPRYEPGCQPIPGQADLGRGRRPHFDGHGDAHGLSASAPQMVGLCTLGGDRAATGGGALFSRGQQRPPVVFSRRNLPATVGAGQAGADSLPGVPDRPQVGSNQPAAMPRAVLGHRRFVRGFTPLGAGHGDGGVVDDHRCRNAVSGRPCLALRGGGLRP